VRTNRVPLAVVLTVSGWVVGIAVTAVIIGTPYLLFGYHSPSLHLVLDSVDGCVALLVAYLLYGRFLRSRRLQDLLLAEGLLLLAVTGLGLTLFLDLFTQLRPETVEVWLPLTLRLAGSLLIAGAALVGFRSSLGRRWDRWSALAPWLLIALAVLVFWSVRDQLPAAVGHAPPASAQHPVLGGHILLLVGQAVSAACFVVASVGFAAQAVRRRDTLLDWLGPAFALAAFARVNYVLFPSLYSDWVYTGDILRTGCYLVLLVGAAREIGQYWSAQARAAVLEDRRRLARELHDGVVQELGYIRAEAHAIGSALSGRIIASCDRALDESRAAIDALGRTSYEPLSFALHRAARQVAERYDGHLEVDLDDSVTADPEQLHALVRITREAVSNALRHGDARRVSMQLAHDQGGRWLVVQDDGRGFDVEAKRRQSTGYGLTSMRERAVGLPGSFSLTSRQGHGTEVGVKW
jgi:signal transduction histidine kinase